MPFDVAFSLEEAELYAWVVIMGEINTGKTFNWATESWPDDDR